jgi:DNA-binding MarR family transcriptional regulator
MSRPLILESYFPFLLGTIANRWTAASSREYLRDFGLGIADWRVLASLHKLGEGCANDVVELIGMDRAAVSRAVARLKSLGLIAPVETRFRRRKAPFALTDQGEETYVKIADIALNREDFLLQDLNPDERQQLLAALRKVWSRANTLELEEANTEGPGSA